MLEILNPSFIQNWECWNGDVCVRADVFLLDKRLFIVK